MGGWLGTWVPAQAAPTRRERDAILRAGRRMLLVSVVFIAALFGLIYAFAGKPSYLIAWGGWMVAFWAYIAVECVRLAREVKRIRAEQDPDDLPNETALACRLDRDGRTVRRPGLPQRSDLPRAPADRHQPAAPPMPPEGGSLPARPPPTAGDGSLAAGSRSATTPEASCWRSARRPADWSRWAAVPSAS